MNVAPYIDHTVLKPTTTIADVEQLCREAAEYGFAAVCIPPPFVKRVKTILDPTRIKVATVIGFPFGYSATEAKMAETVLAIVDGADELDVVMNLVALRMHDFAFLSKEVQLLTEVIHKKGKIIKLIIESGILSDEEIIQCCQLFGPLGIDFMKTSTGYAEKGASVKAVQLMRAHLPVQVQIKASGGIKSNAFATELIAAGASRLGCSASVQIVKEAGETK
ncbi:MAG TPA: deoxyribose-phosphate aldolase [Chitinophagaceae bacterium]|nr:deoxyribose-phosphate aldolase [Chitinophagaceae bacterium]